MSHRAYTSEQEALIVELFANGEKLSELERRFGGTITAIRSCLRRHGAYEPRPGGRPERVWSAEEATKMLRLWDEGFSQTAIANMMGVSQSSVSRILRREGVELNARNPVHQWIGSDASGWKGGRVQTAQGYIRAWVAPNDPLAEMRDRTGYVLEHRLVMARQLGRPLDRYETVHHINGDRGDNRPENLQLRVGRHGKGMVPVCRNCGSHNIGSAPLEQ